MKNYRIYDQSRGFGQSRTLLPNNSSLLGADDTMMLSNKWCYLCYKHLLLSLNLLLLSRGHLLQLRQSEFHTLISNLSTHMDVVKIVLEEK